MTGKNLEPNWTTFLGITRQKATQSRSQKIASGTIDSLSNETTIFVLRKPTELWKCMSSFVWSKTWAQMECPQRASAELYEKGPQKRRVFFALFCHFLHCSKIHNIGCVAGRIFVTY